jgi:hypothetical protein
VSITPLPVPRFGAFSSKPSGPTNQPPQGILCELPCLRPAQDVWAQVVVQGTVATEPATWSRVKGLYE